MRRLLGAVAVAAALLIPGLAVALGTSSSVAHRAAGTNDSLAFYLYENESYVPVDYLTWCGDCVGTDFKTGSPWVLNPDNNWPFTGLPMPIVGQSGCNWDSDDFYDIRSTGATLDAGATAAATACWYAPTSPSPIKFTYFQIYSSSPDLLVSEHFAWSGGSHDSPYVAPVRAGAAWKYQACWYGPVTLLPGGTAVGIPDSHGGSAVPVTVTINVENPSSHRASKTFGVFSSDFRDNGLYCPDWPTIPYMP